MPRRFSFKLLLAAWLALEIILLTLVVSEIGWLGSILLGFASTLLGFGVVRDAGADVFSLLQSTFRQGNGHEHRLADQTLKGIAGLCLVLPGFLSDLIGLALVAPSVRQRIMRLWGGQSPTRTTTRTGIIDLDPQDWHPS